MYKMEILGKIFEGVGGVGHVEFTVGYAIHICHNKGYRL